MTQYTLFSGVSAPNPPFPNMPVGTVVSTGVAPTDQSYAMTVTNTEAGGQVHASADILGSNDGANWFYVATLQVQGAAPQSIAHRTHTEYLQYAGYVTDINHSGHVSATLTLAV